MTMSAISDLTRRVQSHLNQGHPVWLFLDYDGTLADFAPTPDIVKPDPHLIHVLDQLSRQPRFRLALISGRMLSQICILVPLERVFLAGTYGVEVKLPDGKILQRIDLDAIRPALERVKSSWTELVDNLEGFFIEDKDWALALHARFAGQEVADRILPEAWELARREINRNTLQLLGGHRFLEIGPLLADKGKTVAWMLDEFPLPEALLIYFGDDDKDEQAFGVIHARGGICIHVGTRAEASQADYLLRDPAQVRNWLVKWTIQGDE
jgi:trehalose 6-phosphate phosphatase